jgi:hypothetical protein
MKVILLFSLVTLSLTAHSQASVKRFLDSTLIQLKSQNTINRADAKVWSIFDAFYNEALQSDKGELSPATAQKINSYVSEKSLPNKHLLILFLMYQQHISETAASGKRPNTEFQVACISMLENEINSVYDRVPAIVYIYKAEALESAGLKSAASALVASSLIKYPTSIPLKVYRFLDSKDDALKRDLIINHPNHWMLEQFRIK